MTILLSGFFRYSREKAKRLQNDDPGTEHILLGTLRNEDGIPVALLRKMGIDIDQILIEVERNLPSGGNTLTFGEIIKRIMPNCRS